jgi:hypothetical protein
MYLFPHVVSFVWRASVKEVQGSRDDNIKWCNLTFFLISDFRFNKELCSILFCLIIELFMIFLAAPLFSMIH